MATKIIKKLEEEFHIMPMGVLSEEYEGVFFFIKKDYFVKKVNEIKKLKASHTKIEEGFLHLKDRLFERTADNVNVLIHLIENYGKNSGRDAELILLIPTIFAFFSVCSPQFQRKRAAKIKFKEAYVITENTQPVSDYFGNFMCFYLKDEGKSPKRCYWKGFGELTTSQSFDTPKPETEAEIKKIMEEIEKKLGKGEKRKEKKIKRKRDEEDEKEAEEKEKEEIKKMLEPHSPFPPNKVLTNKGAGHHTICKCQKFEDADKNGLKQPICPTHKKWWVEEIKKKPDRWGDVLEGVDKNYWKNAFREIEIEGELKTKKRRLS